MVDAAFGEVLVTCEKVRWLLSEGERWLRPEARSTGRMVKSSLTILKASIKSCHSLAEKIL